MALNGRRYRRRLACAVLRRVQNARMRWPFLALMAAVIAAPASAAPPLRVAVGSSQTMPMMQFYRGEPNAGIVFDIVRALGAALDRPLAFVVLPRGRIEAAVLNGEADLTCYVNRKWARSPELFDWSPPLFPVQDVLFGHTASPQAAGLDDIPEGSVVGMARGYVFPLLFQRIADRRLVREDADDNEKVLLKVSAARTPYAVVNRFALDWYRRTVRAHAIGEWTIEIQREDFHCHLPKGGRENPAPIFAALERLKREGRLEAILKKYR